MENVFLAIIQWFSPLAHGFFAFSFNFPQDSL